MKLHLGCGRTRLDGWVNVDHAPIQDVTDVVVDLDGPDLGKAFDADSVSESLGLHVIEHLRFPLAFMEALWTVTKPDGTVTFETPYGSSDEAWEDPTHTRPYFANSWSYFAQPNYFRADYGYRADWLTTSVVLAVDPRYADTPTGELMAAIRTDRNVVRVMQATLEAVKPAREPLAELRVPVPVSIALAQ